MASGDDIMRKRKSRGKEEAHLAAPFDYLERPCLEQVRRADEKEQKFREPNSPFYLG